MKKIIFVSIAIIAILVGIYLVFGGSILTAFLAGIISGILPIIYIGKTLVAEQMTIVEKLEDDLLEVL